MKKSTIKFEEIIKTSNNPIGTCVALIMCWLMVCDEEVTDEEIDYLKSVSPPENIEFFSDFINQSKAAQIPSIYSACKLLDNILNDEGKEYLVELLLGMMIADNRISISELYIIGFIADLFFIKPATVNKKFRSLTGQDLPEPGDPSSIEWWKEKEKQYRKKSTANKDSNEQKEWAYSVLGINENSSVKEIRDAYHKMCHLHHPDKFIKLGPEAVKAASIIFIKINQAYDVLVKQ